MWSKKDARDLAMFLVGTTILLNEAFLSNPPLDRVGLIGAALVLMGYGVGKFNGRH